MNPATFCSILTVVIVQQSPEILIVHAFHNPFAEKSQARSFDIFRYLSIPDASRYPFLCKTVDPMIRQTRQLTFPTFEAAPLLAAPNGQVMGENRHSVCRCRHIELLLVI